METNFHPAELSCLRLSTVAPVGSFEESRKCVGPSTSIATCSPPHSTTISTLYPCATMNSSRWCRPSAVSAFETRRCMRDGFVVVREKTARHLARRSEEMAGHSPPTSSRHKLHWCSWESCFSFQSMELPNRAKCGPAKSASERASATAKAHAVLASSCALKLSRRGEISSANEWNKCGGVRPTLAKAQARFAKPCGEKSESRCSAAFAIASKTPGTT
mmetsp:Transcript_34759/g.81438  ORF Transcript_34759/g.81438 Transcript_34759/m.81438 type:complete len:218 (+) Transcript_34759:487-1140(+)